MKTILVQHKFDFNIAQYAESFRPIARIMGVTPTFINRFDPNNPFCFNECNKETKLLIITDFINKNGLVDFVDKMSIANQITVNKNHELAFSISPIIVICFDYEFDSIPGKELFKINQL